MYKVLVVEDFEGLWTFRVVGLLMFLSKGVLYNSNMKTPVFLQCLVFYFEALNPACKWNMLSF